jgi:Trypsin
MSQASLVSQLTIRNKNKKMYKTASKSTRLPVSQWSLTSMKNFLFLIAGLSVVAAADPFIVGGRDAELGQFPWMVSIRFEASPGDDLRHGCGGGILNKNWIITAAHCILSGYQRIVVAGSVRLQDAGDRYRIVRSIPHPQYRDSNSHWHEWVMQKFKVLFGYATIFSSIGLLQVEDITFTQFVQPIPLNRRNIRLPTPAVLSGHGHYTTNVTEIRFSEHLQFKNTTILTNFDCAVRTALTGVVVEEDYRPIIYPGHLCTLVGRGIGGCYGDSGSALVANGGVVGVVSFGLSCARGAPDIFIRVSHYLRWIDLQMRLWG